jgi:hypothetical protein
MRILRRMADRLFSRLMPEVTASAIWRWEYQCNQSIVCNRVQKQRQRRHCHDGTGFCYPWENYGCCSP